MHKPEIIYRALVADKLDDGSMDLSIKKRNTRDLPDYDVLVRVQNSSLNYKDALSAGGNTSVTKSYPHTPGIDAAGTVEWSRNVSVKAGDQVIVTSYDLGQNTPGGFGEYISVPGEWVVPLPDGLSLKESMIFGTAGFTAAYGVKKIVDQQINPEDGKILVTGATGGVGSMAVMILSKLGYNVVAVTGKKEKYDFLKNLGAASVLSRDEVTEVSGAPLLSSRWVGSIDTVGGKMLDAVIRQTSHNGAIACCGNILGGKLDTSIYPFILRGVALMGIDSGICLMEDRLKIWGNLAGDWKPGSDLLGLISKECTIPDLPAKIEKIRDGRQSGRVVVNLRGG